MRRAATSTKARVDFFVTATLSAPRPMALGASEGDGLPPERMYTTSLGELRRVILDEHAVANLNTGTVLRIVPTRAGCSIVLDDGEALFEIRHDDGRGIGVTAGIVALRADASMFSARRRDADHVDVLVRKGSVIVRAVSSGAARAPGGGPEPMRAFKDTLVAADQFARASPAGLELKQLDAAEASRRLEWTTGYLAFGGETLLEVAAEFNRYNGQRLVVEDPSIGRLRIGGRFQATDPEVFVAAFRPMGVRRLDSRVRGSSASFIRLVGERGQ
jgi:transmembrane sensor